MGATVAMQPADPLQKQVSGSQIGDQHIGVHVEGLLRKLGGDHRHALRPLLPGLRSHQTQALLGPVPTVRGAQPGVQQMQLAVKSAVPQLLVDRLRPSDLIDHHQGDSTIGHGRPYRFGYSRTGSLGVGQPGELHRYRPTPRRHHLTRGLSNRPAFHTVGDRHTRIPGRLRDRLVHIRLPQHTGQIGVHEQLPLRGRQRRRQQHHWNSGLPKPPKGLNEELPHVHIRGMHLVNDHDLSRQPGEPEHDMPRTSRRIQQMIHRTHRERGE